LQYLSLIPLHLVHSVVQTVNYVLNVPQLLITIYLAIIWLGSLVNRLIRMVVAPSVLVVLSLIVLILLIFLVSYIGLIASNPKPGIASCIFKSVWSQTYIRSPHIRNGTLVQVICSDISVFESVVNLWNIIID
jgi:hypothetical protein